MMLIQMLDGCNLSVLTNVLTKDDYDGDYVGRGKCTDFGRKTSSMKGIFRRQIIVGVEVNLSPDKRSNNWR